jgi:hypothetical protein
MFWTLRCHENGVGLAERVPTEMADAGNLSVTSPAAIDLLAFGSSMGMGDRILRRRS